MTYLVKFISLSLFFSLNYLSAMEDPSAVQNQYGFGDKQGKSKSSKEEDNKSLPNLLVDDGCSASQEDVSGSPIATFPITEFSIGIALEGKDKESEQERSLSSREDSSKEKKSKSLSKSKSSSRSSSRSQSKSETSKSKKISESSASESSAAISVSLENTKDEGSGSSSSSSQEEESSDASDSETSKSSDLDSTERNASIEYVRDSGLEENIEVANSSNFVRFFENDYELPQAAADALENIEFDLILGNQISSEKSKNFSNYQPLIAKINEFTRPQIVLTGKQKASKREELDKESLQLLEQHERVEGEPEDTNKIKKVTATLNADQRGFNLERLVQSSKPGVMKDKNDVIRLESLGSCIAFNKYNNTIYVGCENGSIYAFDAETKELTATFRAHKESVSALEIIKKGAAFISHADEGRTTYVWSVKDTRARIKLEDEKFSKTYIFSDGKKIIRSHIGGKSLASSYFGSVSVTDGVYKIPEGYLKGKVPGGQASRIALLHCMKNLSNWRLYFNNEAISIINRLLDSFVINTFEPPVTKALKLQLKDHLKEITS